MTERLRPEPYVGVSGVVNIEQHGELCDLANEVGLLNDEHFLMLGIQATSKTQLQGMENKRGRDWHPVGDDISWAAGNEDSGLTKPFIHCFFEGTENLAVGLRVVKRRTIHYAQGIQINMVPWMDENCWEDLADAREVFQNGGIVLEANRNVLENHKPAAVAKRLGGLPIDYVLFDGSHGFGAPLDHTELRPFVDAVYQTNSKLGVGVAGGLGPRTVDDLLGPLMSEYPDLSCDAEGKLRSGPDGKTVLDMTKVAQYLHEWNQLRLTVA
jgi:hypothetical protein